MHAQGGGASATQRRPRRAASHADTPRNHPTDLRNAGTAPGAAHHNPLLRTAPTLVAGGRAARMSAAQARRAAPRGARARAGSRRVRVPRAQPRPSRHPSLARRVRAACAPTPPPPPPEGGEEEEVPRDTTREEVPLDSSQDLSSLLERLAAAQPDDHARAALEQRVRAQLPRLVQYDATTEDHASTSTARSSKSCSEVWLVGTGPGDPELLTLKALRLMQTADVVLYDRLVSPDILRMVHPAARMVYVGKAAGQHTRTQEEIHTLLGYFADAGQAIVRLKGGDPFVFGRGGEEMEYLASMGLEIKCVPGITAAAGICASLGVPQTHRGVANSVRFLTGHSRPGGEDPAAIAAEHADPDTTTCVYMGLQTLPKLVDAMLANGLDADTPAVAVERGTTARARTVFATLADLPRRVGDAELESPTLMIVGKVVALSPYWERWKEGGVLSGLDTRAEGAGETRQDVGQQQQGQPQRREGALDA